MKKYSWNFNKDAVIWQNETHDTIEECLKDAWGYAEDDKEVVYIGENYAYTPHVDAGLVLDYLEEEASDLYSEVAEDWKAYDCKKNEELQELSEQLTKVVREWLKKYDRWPEFYTIGDIVEYKLKKVVEK